MDRPGEAATGRLEEAVRLVRDRSALQPRAVLVVGPTLAGPVTAELSEIVEVGLAALVRADGPPGARLLLARLRGVPVAALTGLPPGRSGPALVLAAEGVRLARLLAGGTGDPPPLLIADECSSVDDGWRADDIALVDDHLNLMGRSPLVGANADDLGPRFPDMTRAYDEALQALAIAAALPLGVSLRRAVYAALPGPQPPTPAERRMLRWMGAELAGTGVVPEVICARHLGMPVLALLAVRPASAPLGRLFAEVVERIGAAGLSG